MQQYLRICDRCGSEIETSDRSSRGNFDVSNGVKVCDPAGGPSWYESVNLDLCHQCALSVLTTVLGALPQQMQTPLSKVIMKDISDIRHVMMASRTQLSSRTEES